MNNNKKEMHNDKYILDACCPFCGQKLKGDGEDENC